MHHWLIKSEPDVYSYDDLARDGETAWDGVRNAAATLNLKAMSVGDLCLYYHSNEGKAVVGVARVSRAAYPDPRDASGRFVAVDVAPERALPRVVTLAAIKADPRLAGMVLVRNSRLSVQPVQPEEWAVVMELAQG